MRWWTGLLDLIFRQSCVLCREPSDRALCLACQTQLQRCRRPPASEHAQVIAWGTYGGALREVIHHMKFHRQPQVAELLGAWLGELWCQTQPRSRRPIVVPIPMNAQKKRDRGFDQAELIARYFSHYARLPYCATGLERIRETQALYSLSAQERQQTVQDAFTLGKGFRRRSPRQPVLLVDDILTTGATTRAVAQVLKHHQIVVQGIAVAARTPQKKSRNSQRSRPPVPKS